MRKNAFTLPFTIFIAFITILIVTGSASLFKTQMQYEKRIQNYYLALAELNLALVTAKEENSLPTDFNTTYAESSISCHFIKDKSSYGCQITLKNGFALSKIISIEKTTNAK
ncbi:competence protein ComG [Listeria welshimeri]|nr:competence protein ComG [Listeria welshimeri]MBC1676441.1 competence protein ComG [Listeria welshimeri]MBC1679894.1 competence protein ComG [Listeria welshimeri]MBC1949462.1 competence protein ComG [Listeria welshimeri]MBC1961783.1 competence protein ComG [Listeria welshimeri]